MWRDGISGAGAGPQKAGYGKSATAFWKSETGTILLGFHISAELKLDI